MRSHPRVPLVATRSPGTQPCQSTHESWLLATEKDPSEHGAQTRSETFDPWLFIRWVATQSVHLVQAIQFADEENVPAAHLPHVPLRRMYSPATQLPVEQFRLFGTKVYVSFGHRLHVLSYVSVPLRPTR